MAEPEKPELPEVRLPEVQWRWRRVYTMGLTAVCCFLLWVVIGRLIEASALRDVAFALIGVIVLMAVLYMAGATVTDIVRLVGAMRGWGPKEGPPK